MRKYSIVGAVLLALVACNKEKSPGVEGQVIARVGDIVITDKDIELSLQGLTGTPLSPQQREAIKNELIKTAVLYKAALEEKMDTNSALMRRIEWMKRSIMVQEYLKSKYGDRKITPQQVDEFIKKNASKFNKKASFIMVMFFDSTLKDTLKELLLDGSMVANKYLDDFARNGLINAQVIPPSNLGLLSLDMPEDMINAIMKAKRNQVLGPFRIQDAYAYVKVLSVENDNPNRPDVQQSVFQYLTMKDQQRFTDSLFNAYKSKFLK